MRCSPSDCEEEMQNHPNAQTRVKTSRSNRSPLSGRGGACVLVLAIVAVLPAAPAAQTATLPFRGYISIDGAHQGAPDDFQDAATFVDNAEEGQLRTEYRLSGGPAFNISGGALIWRQLGVGVGFSRFSRSTPAFLSATVPHPFVFDRDRPVEGEVGGLKREELAVNIRASAVLPVGRRTQVLVFGGPSFFRVRQGIVTDFTYTDAYPFDTAAFDRGETVTARESKVGVNAGADVAFYFTPQLGVGGMVQFAGTTLELPSAAGGTQDVKTGGLQAGGGLRLRFWR
jgi:hypothetical protein